VGRLENDGGAGKVVVEAEHVEVKPPEEGI
jgi:hypothetical protein